ncbi:LapA family protein [Legionella geestiana]|nr:LapA family protein [Legionella geestiana]
MLMLLVYVLLVVLGVSFAALNATAVPVNFYLYQATLPISVLMTLSLGAGILLGVALMLRRMWRLSRELRAVKNQLQLRGEEIKNLRSIPLQN